MATWHWSESHGAAVPSGRASKLASAPWIPDSGQSGCEDRSRCSTDASGRLARGRGDIAARHSSRVGNRSDSSIQPPSMHTTPRTSSGWRWPRSSATLAPTEWPATTGRSHPISSMTHTRSSVRVAKSYPPGGLSERPWPRWSTAATPWPSRWRYPATPSQTRALAFTPWTSTNGTPSPSHTATWSVTPPVAGTRRGCAVTAGPRTRRRSDRTAARPGTCTARTGAPAGRGPRCRPCPRSRRGACRPRGGCR